MTSSPSVKYAARGKDYLVALRPYEARLLMHQLFHADEVRPVAEVPAPESQPKPAELKLARELISRLRSDRFAPHPRAKVVDLMEALKASLAEKGKKERPPERRRARALRKAG